MKNNKPHVMEYVWAFFGLLFLILGIIEWISKTFSEAKSMIFISLACAFMYFWRKRLRENQE